MFICLYYVYLYTYITFMYAHNGILKMFYIHTHNGIMEYYSANLVIYDNRDGLRRCYAK